MRRVIAALAVVAFATMVVASAFSDGWKAGYKKGWCYEQRYCVAPFPPFAPFPEIGKTKWIDGYNAGFLQGLADRP